MNKFVLLNRTFWKGLGYFLGRIHSTFAIPTAINLCLTDKCNLKCPYCMRESFIPPKGNMTLPMVKNLMLRMPYIWNVTIQGLCEPFLNPECPEIITWLKSQNYHIGLTTNGTIPLIGPRLSCLRSVDDLCFSIDTYEPKVFQWLRGGAQLSVVMQNLLRVVEMKRTLKLSKNENPPIYINAVISPYNMDHIGGLLKMLEPYADQINYLQVNGVSRPDYSKFKPFLRETEI